MKPYSLIALRGLLKLSTVLLMVVTGEVYSQDYEVFRSDINSDEADFSGVFANKDIIFCSSRKKTNLSFDDDSLTLYYTDLYISRMKPDGNYGIPEPLKGNINSDFNEGQAAVFSDGRRMLYTANLRKSNSNKFDKISEYKLGLFYAEMVNGVWINKGEFAFNSKDSKYSVAHPCLSANDSILYFCSNMSGGQGNSDIYRCIWKDGTWSEPENLGSKVNSKGNEFFPFINEFGVLFFSTNARNDSEGMDIYYAMEEDGEFQKPLRLNNTINTEADEFAYSEMRGSSKGCFSSNRNGEQDDLFFFKKYVNTFNDCHENYQANFCYHFFDENLTNLDSLPIAYEWQMGDGTILRGGEVDYCYKNYGKFNVSLNVIDTSTRVVFKKVSEMEIVIHKQETPYIISHDTVYQSLPFECQAEIFAFDAFEVDKIEWQTDDGGNYQGRTFKHVFADPGIHQIKCGVSGKPRKNGTIPTICVFKDVVCVSDQPEDVKELLCCDKREYEKIAMKKAEFKPNIESRQLQVIYKLIIAESKEPLQMNDMALSRIDAEITEIKTDSGYQYAIEETTNWQDLIQTYQVLAQEGYTNMHTEEFTRAELARSITKIIPRNPNNAIKIKSGKPVHLASGKRISFPSSDVSSSNAVKSAEHNPPTHANIESIHSQTELNVEHKANDTSITESAGHVVFTDSSNHKIDPSNVTTEKAQETAEQIKDQQEVQAEALDSAAITDSNVKIQPNEHGTANIETQRAQSTVNEIYALAEKEKNTHDSLIQRPVNYYRIILTKSATRIPFNDTLFKPINTSISELRRQKGYAYSIMNTPHKSELVQPLEEAKELGFKQAEIEQFDLNKMKDEVVKTGKYIKPGDATKLNVEFSRLSDIKFEYNSAEIKQESYENLNYIAAMLKLEKDFVLKISAHTCAIGGAVYNQELSEKRAAAVIEYFTQQGINPDRLIAKGYGSSKPKQSNEDEMGRAANRRVEFVIVFQVK